MSAVRGFTPYAFLNPEDDEEGSRTIVTEALKPKLKAPVTSIPPHKKSAPPTPKLAGKAHLAPSAPAKSQTPNTVAEPSRKQQNKESSDEPSYDQDLPTGRDHQRSSPSINKRRDRPARSTDGAATVDTRRTRRVTSLRKDSLKKEVAGKSTWGDPLESQKGGAEEVTQEPAEDDAATAPRSRKPYRTGNAPSGNKQFPKKNAQRQDQQNNDAGDAPGSPTRAEGEQQTSDKNSQVQKPVDAKPAQLTLMEYIASIQASDQKIDEPAKKSKGLYVASDNSDWTGVAINPPKSPEKVDRQQKNGKKKPHNPKAKSTNIVLSFGEGQMPPPTNELHSGFRPQRNRGTTSAQKDTRKPRGDRPDSQEHGPRRYQGSQKPPAKSHTTEAAQPPPHDNPPEATPASEKPEEVDHQKKFSLDFPALS